MATDEELFGAWREAERRGRQMRWMAAIAVAACILSVIALIIAGRALMRGSDSSTSVGDRDDPGTGLADASVVAVDSVGGQNINGPQETEPPLPLAAAMRAAEMTLPPRPAIAEHPHKAPDQRSDCNARYRLLLAAGEPVVFAGDCRPTSLAFAERLSAGYREDWLRACMAVVERCGASSDSIRSLKEKHGIWVYPLCRDWPWSSLEAIYNLSQDANLRIRAKTVWDTLADQEYARAVEHWESLRGKPNIINVGPRPRRRSLPSWRAGQP